MDIVTPVFDICVKCWELSAKYRLLIKGFRRSLKNLSVERERLVDVSKDVKIRVMKDQQERNQVATREVIGWLKRVEDISKEVDDIVQKGEEAVQKSCLGGRCPTNCRSRYKLAKEADEVKKGILEELNIGRNFKDGQVTSDVAEHSSLVGTQEPTVGMDLMFDTVLKWIEDPIVRSIGLFGVGGVGKTTLLTKIHNSIVTVNPNYYPVLWVVVSQPVNVDQIQEKIWKQLKFSDKDWVDRSKAERCKKIHDFLGVRNFIVFLDDLWESLDLDSVGIPHYQANSKLIFTTRSDEVCGRMRVEKRMKVECLPPKEALQLFREKLGEDTWNAHPRIPELAEIIVKECDFLPLALATVGRALIFKKQLHHWEEAAQVLKTRPAKFQGMKEQVISRLEFSYHALPDETHKKCFLYCCLFPEDFYLDKYDLFELWIGEGFFDEHDNIHKVRTHCEDVFDKLSSACLLEKHLGGTSLTEKYIVLYKMHDLIREMALCVTRDTGKILVQENQRTIGLSEFEKWKDAEMVSVMHAGTVIQEFPTAAVPCLNLSTLILRSTTVESFPCGFFSSMPSLKVLDLSYNSRLRELAGDIGELTSLQYLGIESTRIKKLPKELKKLVKLRFLFLNSIVDLEDFSEGSMIIPSLRLFRSTYNPDLLISEAVHCEKLMKSLQGVEAEKSEVSLVLYFASEVHQLWTYPEVQSCLKSLTLKSCDGLTSVRLSESSVKAMKHLQNLSIAGCHNLGEISIEIQHPSVGVSSRMALQPCFHNLRQVSLVGCWELLHLTSLIYSAPYLEIISLKGCRRMTELVREGSTSTTTTTESQTVKLSCLRALVLRTLPKLKSICGKPLPFPSLTYILVYNCASLQKLPLGVNGSNQSQYDKLQQIEGDQMWWDRLKWNDRATKQLLAPKFKAFPE